MGMFDWVNFATDCPDCGTHIDGFQSKDLDCQLERVEPDEVLNFYSYCKSCGAWIEFTRMPAAVAPRDVPLTEAQVLALGFTKTKTPGRVKANPSPAGHTSKGTP